MDALMAALLFALLAGLNGRDGTMIVEHSAPERRRAVVIAFALAVAVNAGVSAALGHAIGDQVSLGVATLLLAFAAAGGAIGLLWRHRKPRLAPTDSFPRAFLAFAVEQLGNAPQFLILAVAATSGAGLWAAVGGTIGALLALVPTLLGGPDINERPGMRAVRVIAAAFLTFTAARALVLAIWGR